MKKKLFTVIIALVLVVATPLAFASMLSGCKKPDPAEEYVALESNAMHKLINDAFANASPSSDVHTTANVELKLSDLFFTIMDREDLNWIDSVSANFDLHQNKTLNDVATVIGMNSKPLFSYNGVVDSLTGITYVSIPTISDYYIQTINNTTVDLSGLQQALAQLNTPETEVAKALLIKYTEVALKNMVNIEKATETLNIKGVTQEVNVYTNYITEKVFLDAFKAILTEAKNDSQLKAIFPDEVNWEAAIEEAIASLNKQTPSDDKSDAIVLITYADKDNKVVGRKLSTSTFSLSHITLSTISGSVSETFIGDAQNNFRLEGRRATPGSSTYTIFITSAGQEIETGTIAVSGDKTAGMCKITLSDFLEQSLFGDASADFAVAIQWDTTSTGTAVDMALSLMAQEVISISASATQSAPKDVTVPSISLNTYSTEDMQIYSDSINTYELMNNMLAIGFPSEYIDAVINALEGTPAE